MADADLPTAGRRSYVSNSRAERARRTRLRIIRSAHQLFVDRGYAAATVRDIARGAGVSVPTVELGFHTKGQLLKVAVDIAVAGDDEPVPVLQRDWAQAASQAATVTDFMGAVSGEVARTQIRAAGLIAAAYEAARHDPEIAQLVRSLERGRTGTAAWIVDRLADHARRSAGVDRTHAVDVVWTLLDPVVFLRLTTSRGWTADEYESWIRHTIPRLLTGGLSTDQPGDTR